jgi:hypothetical protein
MYDNGGPRMERGRNTCAQARQRTAWQLMGPHFLKSNDKLKSGDSSHICQGMLSSVLHNVAIDKGARLR